MIAAGAAILVAGLGGLMTDIGSWYENLRKPDWQPPGWLFGPAWTLIFTLTAIAGVMSWIDARSRADQRLIITLAAANGALNVLWSILFFRLHRPDWSVIEVVALWLSVLAMLIGFGKSARVSGWLILPYLVWVSFAGFLNWEIVHLNAPFGGG